jgi:hypothetical protein
LIDGTVTSSSLRVPIDKHPRAHMWVPTAHCRLTASVGCWMDGGSRAPTREPSCGAHQLNQMWLGEQRVLAQM